MAEPEYVIRRTSVEQTEATRAIQTLLEDITLQALQEARNILNFGLADQKLALIRTIVSGSMKIVGSDAAVVEEEAKSAIESIWTTMRKLPNGSTPRTLAAGTDDPDQIPND